ncbi:MAG: Fe2+-dependent dioxygenase [Pseudomonadota bacterium]
MFQVVDTFLTADEVQTLRTLSETMTFVDGKSTNSDFSAKQNLQASAKTQDGQRVANMIRSALARNEWAMEICRPKAMAAPLLAKYEPGMAYGEHVDTALITGGGPVRVDISCTVFLSDPESYDGGELVVRPGNREFKIKEPAGAAVFYPSTHYHEVAPVTRGERLVGLTFIESAIRDAQKRHILFELEELRHKVGANLDNEALMQLEFVRLNLLRMWHGD